METNSLKLDKAYNLVTTHWFPYEPSTLNEIEGKLLAQVVEKKEITALLKKDCSIFLMCLKELVEMTAGNKFNAWDKDVLCFIESASIDQIKHCIKKIKEKPISHLMRSSTSVQKQRLSEMIVSSQTVDSLSNDDEVLNEVAFSCALVRQLGYTLIAWNYPRIFEAITSKVHTKESLDSEFVSTLGFSPLMLACTLLEKWGLPLPYMKAVQDRGSVKVSRAVNPVQESKKDIVTRVGNICSVGEALARATNPTLFKTAEEDIEMATSFIESFLGKGGVQMVLSSSRERFESSSLEIPFLLEGKSQEELDAKIKRKLKGANLYSANPYLDNLPEDLHDKVSHLYNDIIPSGPSYASVSVYAKEIYPVTAFSALHVYLFDPFERKLYPSLVLGKSVSFSPRPYFLKTATGRSEILIEALKTKAPIIEDSASDDQDDLIMIASSLGGMDVVGVMYVEILKSNFIKLSSGANADPLRYFKAFKILLSDCLGLQ